MANGGWHGTKEEWQRAEIVLLPFDPVLEEFARCNGITLTKNGKDWPERSLRWESSSVSCLIQIFMESVETRALNFWICASQDRDDSRYWKQELLEKAADASRIGNVLPELLSSAKKRLNFWCSHPEEFEFATKLSTMSKRP
jgi:hypothetical protein